MAARARADRPNTAISTRNLPVSVSHDADFGATSFHQTKRFCQNSGLSRHGGKLTQKLGPG